MLLFCIFIGTVTRLAAGREADQCTAIAVGPKATVDGSTFNTHTADCKECDWRINKVAARDWPPGWQRPIFLLSGAYPRQVRDDKGVTWSKANLEGMSQKADWEALENTLIIGYIPQVPHTFAYIEGNTHTLYATVSTPTYTNLPQQTMHRPVRDHE
jgi:hypothetical protein